MDLGTVSPTTAGHYVRLAVVFFASVLGLLVLGFIFGSSSASADDGGPDDSGLVPAVAELAGGVGETVAPVTAPVAAAIPLADVPLSPVGDVLGPAPAAPLVGALVKTLDTTIDTAIGAVTDALARAVNLLEGFAPATAVAQPPAASGITATAALISGIANGASDIVQNPFQTGSVASGAAPITTALPIAALGAGFLVLFLSRRPRLADSALPVSPVYETDTSPD